MLSKHEGGHRSPPCRMHAGQGCSNGGAASGAACSEAARAHAAASEQRSDGMRGVHRARQAQQRRRECHVQAANAARTAAAAAAQARSSTSSAATSAKRNALLRVPLVARARQRVSPRSRLQEQGVWLMGWCLAEADCGCTPTGQERRGARSEVSRHALWHECLPACALLRMRPAGLLSLAGVSSAAITLALRRDCLLSRVQSARQTPHSRRLDCEAASRMV